MAAVLKREDVVDVVTCLEEWDNVSRGTEGVDQGGLEGDVFEDGGGYGA